MRVPTLCNPSETPLLEVPTQGFALRIAAQGLSELLNGPGFGCVGSLV